MTVSNFTYYLSVKAVENWLCPKWYNIQVILNGLKKGVANLFCQAATKLSLEKIPSQIHMVTIIIHWWDIWYWLKSEKTYNVTVKWRGWQKEFIRHMMIWQLCTVGIFYFEEQLFTMVCNPKHIHPSLDVRDKVRESSRWKHVVLIKIKKVAS